MGSTTEESHSIHASALDQQWTNHFSDPDSLLAMQVFHQAYARVYLQNFKGNPIHH